jgi:hypothetical protein
MKREIQKSLLDLEPEQGPSPRQELHWHLFYRQEFERIAATFDSRHGQQPIFWSRFIRRNFDLFMTSPREVMLVSLSSGQLIDPQEHKNDIWGLSPKDCTVERPRHLSPQITAFLAAKLPWQGWQPEIMEHIGFVPEKRDLAMALLQDHGLTTVMDRAWFRNVIRVFGPPQTLRKAYKAGADSGIFK